MSDAQFWVLLATIFCLIGFNYYQLRCNRTMWAITKAHRKQLEAHMRMIEVHQLRFEAYDEAIKFLMKARTT
jgi:hypothetical protein